MFARISTFQGPPERTTQGIRVAREQILPVARLQDGFRGIYLLHDPESGRSISVTLWDNEEDMSSSEEAARRARAESVGASGDAVVSVERFEVALEALIEPDRDPKAPRNRAEYPPGAGDDVIYARSANTRTRPLQKDV